MSEDIFYRTRNIILRQSPYCFAEALMGVLGDLGEYKSRIITNRHLSFLYCNKEVEDHNTGVNVFFS